MSNLKELLSYRKKCLIHGKPLRPVLPSGLKFHLSKGQLSLSILRGQKKDSVLCNLTFNADGTYSCTKDCFKYIDNSVYFYMVCDDCQLVSIEENRALTSLGNIRDVQYFYTFNLTANPKSDKYDSELGKEEIKYCTDNKFYHTVVNLKDKSAVCEMGRCAGPDTLHEIWESLLVVKVPQLNMEKIKKLEQYLDKMKLYAVFS